MGNKISLELIEKSYFVIDYYNTNLYNFISFYNLFPNIFHIMCGKSPNIHSRSHYRLLIRVEDKSAREWYAKVFEQTWSVRTLERNIETLYYFRLLASKDKQPVIDKMKEKTVN